MEHGGEEKASVSRVREKKKPNRENDDSLAVAIRRHRAETTPDRRFTRAIREPSVRYGSPIARSPAPETRAGRGHVRSPSEDALGLGRGSRWALRVRTMRSATAVELSPTAASWSRMSASRSSSALPTGPKMVLSRITMRSRNSVAMMGRVRLKSKILPGSPAMEGIATSALVTAAMTAGFTDLGSSTLLLDGKIHETRDAGKDGQPRRGRREERRVPRVVGASRARARRVRTIHGSDVPFTATSGTRERRARREPPYPLLRCARAERKSGQRRGVASISPDAPELGHGGDGGGAGAHGLARGRDLGAREEAALDSRDSRHRCWRLRVRV